MKKILMTILTAGLAFAMIGNTGTAYAEENDSTLKESQATVTFKSPINGLKLDSVSSINFGTNEISDEDLDIDSAESPSLKVVDFRGTHKGWNVSATLSEFSNTYEEKTHTLQGAKLKLQDGNVGFSGGENKKIKDTVIIPESESGAISVVSAEEGTGSGVSTANWAKANLTVPGSVLAITNADTYKATITWTLKDAP